MTKDKDTELKEHNDFAKIKEEIWTNGFEAGRREVLEKLNNINFLDYVQYYWFDKPQFLEDLTTETKSDASSTKSEDFEDTYSILCELLNNLNDDLELDFINGEEGYKSYEESYKAIKKYTLPVLEKYVKKFAVEHKVANHSPRMQYLNNGDDQTEVGVKANKQGEDIRKGCGCYIGDESIHCGVENDFTSYCEECSSKSEEAKE